MCTRRTDTSKLEALSAKPNYDLVQMAIMSSPSQEMKAEESHKFFKENFSYFATRSYNWRYSIRDVLSSRYVVKSRLKPGDKTQYYIINPEL